MSLSAAEIAAVVAELAPLQGGTIQKIRAPSPRTVVFELRVPGETHQLLLSAEPDQTRLHLTGGRPPSPAAPLPIQNLLRAHLLPSKLLSVEAVEGERIARLRFQAGEGGLTLVAELTGRHGNLILLGPGDRILGLAVPSASSTRAILPGKPYAPPPAQPPRRQPVRFRVDPARGAFPLSAAIDAAYGPEARARDLEARRRDASRTVAAARKRVASALEKLAGDEARAADAAAFRRYGDLLAPLAARVPRGARAVTATDYTAEGPVEVEVPLRADLSPRENVERYYKEYRRMRDARERIAARRAELEQRRAALEGLWQAVRAAESEAELDELARQAARFGARRPQPGPKAREEAKLPYRSFVSATGRPILVGRGARQNDQLTFRLARGSDLWLHARGQPGAHVVVPLRRGDAADEATLLDACALACWFSGAKHETVAEIAYTHVRHVRKPKGGAPGAVIYTQERTLAYRDDPERITRLLERPPP